MKDKPFTKSYAIKRIAELIEELKNLKKELEILYRISNSQENYLRKYENQLDKIEEICKATPKVESEKILEVLNEQ